MHFTGKTTARLSVSGIPNDGTGLEKAFVEMDKRSGHEARGKHGSVTAKRGDLGAPFAPPDFFRRSPNDKVDPTHRRHVSVSETKKMLGIPYNVESPVAAKATYPDDEAKRAKFVKDRALKALGNTIHLAAAISDETRHIRTCLAASAAAACCCCSRMRARCSSSCSAARRCCSRSACVATNRRTPTIKFACA